MSTNPVMTTNSVSKEQIEAMIADLDAALNGHPGADHLWRDCGTIRDKLRALSVSRPAVRKLIWVDIDEYGPDAANAACPYGWYYVVPDEDSSAGRLLVSFVVNPAHVCMAHAVDLGSFYSFEEAFGAAQTHFENATLSALSSLSPPTGTGEPLTFGYTNWRGEYAERTAIPLRIERKESEWHGPGLHYVMVAFDVEKQAERDFLLTDMGRSAPTEKGVDGNTPS